MTQLQVLEQVFEWLKKDEVTSPKEIYQNVFKAINDAKEFPPFGTKTTDKFVRISCNTREKVIELHNNQDKTTLIIEVNFDNEKNP